MASELFVTVESWWEFAEGDGGKCVMCGDACYLQKVVRCMSINGGEKTQVDGISLCQSCGEDLVDGG